MGNGGSENGAEITMTEATNTEWMDAALSHFSAVMAAPENAATHLNLAIWLQRAERWDAAAQEFQRTLWLEPREAARVGLGACLLKLNRVEDALEVFDHGDDAPGPVLFGKAVALQLLRRFDEAESVYEILLESQPDSQETLANLIAMSAETRDLENVREYSQKLLSIAPQSAVALQGLATVALERRDNHAAAKYCDRIVELAPDCLEGWHNLRIALDRILSAFTASKPPASIPEVR
jgi:tetratricopeptide (TPR) repeat protein